MAAILGLSTCLLLGVAGSSVANASSSSNASIASIATNASNAPNAPNASHASNWTAAEAIAGLTVGAIFTVPGSVAKLDEPAVRQALAGTPIQVLILPHNGLESANRDIQSDKSREVRDWARGRDITLIVIDGLQIHLPPLYNLVPTDFGELQPMLLRNNVTSLVLSGVDRLVAQAAEVDYVDQRTDPMLEAAIPADPALIRRVGDALASDRVYSAPGVDPSITRVPGWDIDITTRVAAFPALEPDERLTDLTAQLAERFTDDVVIVVHGQWLEVAGPQQDLLDAALLELYGEYYTAISEWGAPLPGLIRILIDKIGVWRSGVVADLAPPAAAPDPVNTIQPLLPWLFLLVGLSIAAIVATGLRARQIRVRTGKSRDQHDFDRASAEMAVIAQRLQLADDNRSGQLSKAATAELARAAERYRTARDILQRRGSAKVAREALATAAQRLTEAGVPVHPNGESDPDEAAR